MKLIDQFIAWLKIHDPEEWDWIESEYIYMDFDESKIGLPFKCDEEDQEQVELKKWLNSRLKMKITDGELILAIMQARAFEHLDEDAPVLMVLKFLAQHRNLTVPP